MSDAYCRLTTEGTYRTRKLYTNTQEVIIKLKRPVAINGIAHYAHQNDYLDRSISLELSSISSFNREPEREFWAKWEIARPRILGALYSAISVALSSIDDVKPAGLPRMADFADMGNCS